VIRLGSSNGLLEQLSSVAGNDGFEANPGWVNGRVGQVSIVESDGGRFQECISQAPPEESTHAGRVGANDLVGNTAIGLTCLKGLDQVGGVNGEHLSANLESEVVSDATRDNWR